MRPRIASKPKLRPLGLIFKLPQPAGYEPLLRSDPQCELICRAICARVAARLRVEAVSVARRESAPALRWPFLRSPAPAVSPSLRHRVRHRTDSRWRACRRHCRVSHSERRESVESPCDRLYRCEANSLDGFLALRAMMPPMKARHFYLVCCVLGLILPYSQFVPWLLEHSVNFTLFVRELFANRISAFFAIDGIVSAIVLIWFIQREGKRSHIPLLLLPVLGTFVVGVSFGFPLFLFLRELTLDRATARG